MPARWENLLRVTLRQARRAIVLVVGGTVLLIGVAMVVLPGPAIVVIPLGLGILAVEFAWARRWLAEVKRRAEGMRRRKGPASTGPASGDSDRPS